MKSSKLDPKSWIAALILVLTLASLFSLVQSRRHWKLAINGGLCSTREEAFPGVVVDANIYFRRQRVKLTSEGSQFVLLPSRFRTASWAEQKYAHAHYAVEWNKKGSFRLNLDVLSGEPPVACVLLFRFPNGGQRVTRPFPLSTQDPDSRNYYGDGPYLRLPEPPGPAAPRSPGEVQRAGARRALSSRFLADDPSLGGLPNDGARLGFRDLVEEGPEARSEAKKLARAVLQNLNGQSAQSLEQYVDTLNHLQALPGGDQQTMGVRLLLQDILTRRQEILKYLPGQNSAQLDADPLSSQSVED